MLEFESLRRPRSPNTYLVAPAGLCREATADREGPVFAAPAAQVHAAWLRVLAGQPRTSVLASDEDRLQVEAVQRSAVFGFIDDVSARFLPLPDGRTAVAVYSRSRVGRYDFEVNRKRVESWLGALGAAAGADADGAP